MRMPRMRFTVRRMMVAVAIVALAVPAIHRVVLWNRYPLLGTANVLYREVPTQGKVRDEAGRPAYALDRAIPIETDFTFIPPPWIPSGLPYRVTAEIKFTDPTFTAVHQAQRRDFYRIVGFGSRGEVRETIACDLKPSRAGWHTVRYELRVTDIFGRTKPAPHASATGGFIAR